MNYEINKIVSDGKIINLVEPGEGFSTFSWNGLPAEAVILFRS